MDDVMSTVKIAVEGMHCHHCKMSVENTIAKIDRVKSFTVSLEKGEAEIVGEPDIQRVIAAIEELGYAAKVVKT